MKQSLTKSAVLLVVVVATFLWLPPATLAQDAPLLEVAVAAICQDVVDREPVDAGVSFSASIGALYSFTKITGAQTPITITHVWYFRNTERARVNLPIKSYTWRTYSSKTIRPDDIGDWRVDVLGPEGEVLSTLHFKITQ